MSFTSRRMRSVAAAALTVGLALGIGACSAKDDGGSDGSTGGPVTISLSYFGTPGFTQAVKDFETANPNIKVDVKNEGQTKDFVPKLAQQISAGSGASDVVMLEEGMLLQYLKDNKGFANLLDLGAASLEKDYLSFKWKNAFTADGKKLVGLGTDVGPLAMCYRTDLFQKAGLPVERDAVSKLLHSDDVETVAVGTAAECLEQLRQHTFDCMVLDLSLPDASGFSLLETLSQEGDHGFPPVIVYTGRELSADEEQRLRRYSNSIIIKGAKSPERLLDEVSLFLHQVVSELPPEQRRMIQKARHRDAALEGRRILIVEDDVRNVYSLTSVLEPRGAIIQIARNGQEALDALEAAGDDPGKRVDLVLMDVMMPVMDGLTATSTIRNDARWTKLPIVMLTAKAMPDDQQTCLEAGANDYMAKPIDVDKLLSLVRVWMPR